MKLGIISRRSHLLLSVTRYAFSSSDFSVFQSFLESAAKYSRKLSYSIISLLFLLLIPVVMSKRWFPLESNPTVMNTYVEKMGLDTSTFSFCDVFSTEDWALSMVPQPVVGVVMLFPIKPESEEFARAEKENIDKNGQIVSSNVYFMKQTVGNACGTVGILHAIGNARSQLDIKPDSYLDRLYQRTSTMTPEAIATDLEADTEIEAVHTCAADEGQSEQQEGEVDTHFVCFSQVDGHLYELDGRKAFPINHGPSSPATLLEDACRVVRAFMDRDPEEVKFTIVALTRTAAEGEEED